MKTEDFFTSHKKKATMTVANGTDFIPALNVNENAELVEQIQSNQDFLFYTSHIRIASLIVEFFHDGASLLRQVAPELDELDSPWKNELIVRDWQLLADKRAVDVIDKKENLEEPYLEQLEFIYTQKGLINQVNALKLLGKEFIVLEKGTTLGFKCLTSLKGGEKLISHCEWDEYFTLFLK